MEFLHIINCYYRICSNLWSFSPEHNITEYQKPFTTYGTPKLITKKTKIEGY